MAERIERVTEVAQTEPVAANRTAAVREVSEARVAGSTVVARVINYIVGVLLVLLAFRFVLVLLGANASNGFANFIYSLSHPFVAPFFGLFNYSLHYGVSRFETSTLVAMAVYAIVGFGIAKLFTITHPNREV